MAVFRSIPINGWCTELNLFAHEVCADMIALSGMKFFTITRRMMLSVVATIITYEIFLIQLHQNDTAPEPNEDHCKIN